MCFHKIRLWWRELGEVRISHIRSQGPAFCIGQDTQKHSLCHVKVFIINETYKK